MNSHDNRPELTDSQICQLDKVHCTAYDLLISMQGLSNETLEQKEKNFPYDISILTSLVEYAEALLQEKNYQACYPSIITDNQDDMRRCNPTDCGFKKCICQDI